MNKYFNHKTVRQRKKKRVESNLITLNETAIKCLEKEIQGLGRKIRMIESKTVLHNHEKLDRLKLIYNERKLSLKNHIDRRTQIRRRL